MENKNALIWNEREIKYLRNNIGYIPLEKIAITLNRTVTAIERKMQHINLSIQSAQMDKNSISFNQLAQILRVDSKVIKTWIAKYRLPAIELKLSAASRKCIYYISVEKFWKWADKHRKVIDWHKLERRALLPEPKWLEEVLREVVPPKKKSWTKQEDVIIWSMYYFESLEIKAIAKKQKRSAASIEKRLKKLRENGFAKEMNCHTPKYNSIVEEVEDSNVQSLKMWTDKEEKRVIQLFYYWCWSQKAVAVELNRTKNAIERKLSSLRKAGRITEKHVQARQQGRYWSEGALQTLQQLRFVEKKKITEIAFAFPTYTVYEITIKLCELKNLQKVG